MRRKSWKRFEAEQHHQAKRGRSRRREVEKRGEVEQGHGGRTARRTQSARRLRDLIDFFILCSRSSAAKQRSKTTQVQKKSAGEWDAMECLLAVVGGGDGQAGRKRGRHGALVGCVQGTAGASAEKGKCGALAEAD
ncbi:hypothetical protein ERJ75_001144800 [Trypanosoma vivax]|nr:hypothetical protein ERJ75_001144800 [Trypanosoma vivax]